MPYTLKKNGRLSVDHVRRTKKNVRDELSMWDEREIKEGTIKIVKVRLVEDKKEKIIKPKLVMNPTRYVPRMRVKYD